MPLWKRGASPHTGLEITHWKNKAEKERRSKGEEKPETSPSPLLPEDTQREGSRLHTRKIALTRTGPCETLNRVFQSPREGEKEMPPAFRRGIPGRP